MESRVPSDGRKVKAHKKTRRSIKYVNKKKDQKFVVLGINCNGLSGKRNSLTANLDLLNPSVFFIQETKFMKKGLFKAKDFEIFKNIRSTGGGSILTGVHKQLNPVLISDGRVEMMKLRFWWLKVQLKKETVDSSTLMGHKNRPK